MPFCHHCGQALVGVYIQAEGKFYHKQCFEKHVVPRCAYCDRPLIGSYIQAEGKVYHKQCFEEHVLPRCVYCQEPLRDRYQIDAWGNQYCQRHQREYPLCSFCGRLVPPEQQTPGWRAYGSERCLVCRSTAIDAIEQAQPLFQRCKQWIAEQGFRFNRLPLHLELHDRAVLLGMLHGRSVNHPLGVTLSSRWSQPGHVYSSSVDGVAVLQGLPATLFAGVVLHELGHVWLTVHGIEGLPSWGEEGFC
ncbi:MAG TPA: protein DA1, partial [Ktedonobacteraceae bacterium]